MTEKLYYLKSHLRDFDAEVLKCEKNGEYFETVLDRTAFFPEGGGQPADTGDINGVRVLDVQERGGEIVHFCDGELAVGECVFCRLDWEKRFRRMQNHTGEHIVSGLVHARFGYDNVGFHMGKQDITIDFSGELTREQLDDIEQAANLAVAENVPVTARFPSERALKRLQYRSKLELTENVRIVTIKGYDVCACCAPHVKRTGEIGVIKLLDFARHRGGVRVHLLCGLDALEDYREKYRNIFEISNLFSSPQHETASAAARLLASVEREKAALATLNSRYISKIISAVPETSGPVCVFEPELDDFAMREIVNECMKRSELCAVFSGSDETGWSYVIGSQRVDLRAKAKEINSAINGRGGGKPAMIQGAAKASRMEIESYFYQAAGK